MHDNVIIACPFYRNQAGVPKEIETEVLQIQASCWYVTSCKDPGRVYNPDAIDAQEKVDQLLQRVTTISNT